MVTDERTFIQFLVGHLTVLISQSDRIVQGRFIFCCLKIFSCQSKNVFIYMAANNISNNSNKWMFRQSSSHLLLVYQLQC